MRVFDGLRCEKVHSRRNDQKRSSEDQFHDHPTFLRNFQNRGFDENIQNILMPIYEIIPGWQVSTFGLTSWDDLPKKAQNYISFLESKIQKNISIISTGPDRAHTIDRNNLLGNN